MITIAFSLYDTKAVFFGVPFFMSHTGQAIRAVMDLGQDNTTQVGRYPHDFHLYTIGRYDDQSGHLIPEPPVNLGPVAGFLTNHKEPPP